MIDPRYRAQVDLLLRILPHVAEEEVFALKGGTAINLFIRDMPRLSVDIDLTYLPLDDRKTGLENIAAGLRRIKERLQKHRPKLIRKSLNKLTAQKQSYYAVHPGHLLQRLSLK